MRNKLPALLSYNDVVYRPAGYRVPRPGEQYIGRDGHLKKALHSTKHSPSDVRLIVREHNPDEASKDD